MDRFGDLRSFLVRLLHLLVCSVVAENGVDGVQKSGRRFHKPRTQRVLRRGVGVCRIRRTETLYIDVATQHFVVGAYIGMEFQRQVIKKNEWTP